MFDEPVWYSYVADKGFLGQDHGNQTSDRCHYKFSILVLHWKLRKAIIFVCEQRLGGVLLPDHIESDKTVITEESIATVMAKKTSAQKTPPQFYARGVWQNAHFCSCGYCRGCGRIDCMENFGEFGAQWYGLGCSTGVALKNQGSTKEFVLVLKFSSTGYPIRNCSGEPIVNLCLTA